MFYFKILQRSSFSTKWLQGAGPVSAKQAPIIIPPPLCWTGGLKDLCWSKHLSFKLVWTLLQKPSVFFVCFFLSLVCLRGKKRLFLDDASLHPFQTQDICLVFYPVVLALVSFSLEASHSLLLWLTLLGSRLSTLSGCKSWTPTPPSLRSSSWSFKLIAGVKDFKLLKPLISVRFSHLLVFI